MRNIKTTLQLQSLWLPCILPCEFYGRAVSRYCFSKKLLLMFKRCTRREIGAEGLNFWRLENMMGNQPSPALVPKRH
jgi:hypothetical protein